MEDKRDRILTIAEDCFARFGFRKTTMDEIARHARMGKSTLYYYFRSKEEVFAAVIQKDSSLMRRHLELAVANEQAPRDKIVAYVLARMRHFATLKNYYVTLTDEFLEQYFFVEEARKEFMAQETSTLEGLLQSGIDEGCFEMESVSVTAYMIVIALKGLEYELFTNRTDPVSEELSRQLLNIVFRGIESRP